MGWSIGFDSTWNRDIGYGVPARCDHPGCDAEIDRGLAYVCGSQPYGGDYGCGLYFCSKHRRTAGDKRDNAELCSRCYRSAADPFDKTPDTAEWMCWKLTDESWQQWRDENPQEVAQMNVALEQGGTHE